MPNDDEAERGTPPVTVSRPGAGSRPADVLTDDEPAGPRRWTRGSLLAGLLVLSLVAAGAALRVVQRHRADQAQRLSQDRIDVEVRSGRTSLGAGGDFFVTALLDNTGPDTLTAVDSRWRGVGLAVVTPIGGLGPVAPGTSASFVARVTPDCSLVGASPDTLAGRIEIELQAPSGRRRTVRLELDRALELLGTARDACALFVAPADRR